MKTLLDYEIYQELKKEIGVSTNQIIIISAFCKSETFLNLIKDVNDSIEEKILLVRFRYQDIVSGASDLEIFEIAKRFKWKVYFNFDIHMKMYIFDSRKCISGSANLTNSGMGISKKHNTESATLYEIDQEDMDKICQIINESVLLTENIYVRMKQQIEVGTLKESKDWDNTILKLYNPIKDKIFMRELPYHKYSITEISKEELFFDCPDEAMIREYFENSNAYQWLKHKLMSKEEHELYFGELTYLLHNDIINEPKPYRKEVKELLSNLLDWVEHVASSEIIIDVPNYSTRVRLK